MKIRNGFISNSSSSSFIVDIHGAYYKSIFNEPDFSYKDGDDLSRCTGVYAGSSLDDFAGEILQYGFKIPDEYLHGGYALVMISDEHMGGTLPYPEKDDYVFQMDWH